MDLGIGRSYMDIKKIADDSRGFLTINIQSDSKKYLVVSFGAIGHGRMGFLFKKQLDRMGVNSIYLNATQDDWYTNGHQYLGGATSTEEAAAFLQKTIMLACEMCGAEKVFLLGQSMGAYGALLYSQFIDLPIPTTCIAMTPQLQLSTDRWSKDSVKAKLIDVGNPHSDLNSLFGNIRQARHKTVKKYVFLYGENDLNDACNILNFKQQMVASEYPDYEVISYKNGSHNLPGAFHSDSELDRILYLLFDGDSKHIPHQGDLHNLLNLEDLENVKKIEHTWDLEGDYVKHLEYLLSKYPNYCLALNRVGVAYLKARQRIKALNYLKLAYLNCQRDANTNVHLTNIYVRLGYFESALTHATIAYQLDKSDAHFDRIGEVLGMIKR